MKENPFQEVCLRRLRAKIHHLNNEKACHKAISEDGILEVEGRGAIPHMLLMRGSPLLSPFNYLMSSTTLISLVTNTSFETTTLYRGHPSFQ